MCGCWRVSIIIYPPNDLEHLSLPQGSDERACIHSCRSNGRFQLRFNLRDREKVVAAIVLFGGWSPYLVFPLSVSCCGINGFPSVWNFYVRNMMLRNISFCSEIKFNPEYSLYDRLYENIANISLPFQPLRQGEVIFDIRCNYISRLVLKW